MNIKNLLAELKGKPFVLGSEIFILLNLTPVILIGGLLMVLKGTYIPLYILALLPVLKSFVNIFAVYIHDLSLRTIGLLMVVVMVLGTLSSVVALFNLEYYMYGGIAMGVIGSTLLSVFTIRYNSTVVRLYSGDGYHRMLSGITLLKSIYKLVMGIVAAGLYLIDTNVVVWGAIVINTIGILQSVYMYNKYWSKV